MNFKKVKRFVATLLSVTLVCNGNISYATEEKNTETEAGNYAEEYKPIDFGLGNFTININANSAYLKWDITAEDAEYISDHSVDVEVYRSVADMSNYTKIASLNSNCQKTMSYTDNTLLAGNKYFYKIRISGYFGQ